jgi:hypothetical protein
MSRIGHHEIVLEAAIKDLQRDWAVTAENWRDAAREEFEEVYLGQLVAAAKAAAGAMGEVSRLLDQAVRECT